MSYFLLLYLLVYGGANLYCLLRVSIGLHLPTWGRAALASFLLLMVAGPLLVHVFDRGGCWRLAKGLGLISHTWIAVMLWLVTLWLPVDIWNLGVRAAGGFRPAAAMLRIPLRPSLWVSGGVVLVLLGYSLLEARAIRLTEVRLTTDRLPPGSPPIRIAHLTDLHMGLHLGQWRFDRAIELLRQAQPDLIVSTGDLFDGRTDRLERETLALAQLRPPLGKLAVLGNHEFYAGLDQSLELHRRCGFELLREQAVRVGPLRVAGVDDPAGTYFRQSRLDEPAALAAADALGAGPLVLLKHRAAVAEASEGRFDLQLSGHSHGGQIFPFHLVTRRFFPRFSGLYELGGRGWLLASHGAGTWGPPLRLLAPPEVTLIVLEPARSEARVTD